VKKSAIIFSTVTIVILILTMLIPIGIAFYKDPLQLYHTGNGRLSKDLRRQAAGIIHNYEFDSIILGSSMAENFSPKEASDIFGETFANISMSGSRHIERRGALTLATRKGKAKTVIYSLDFDYDYNTAATEYNPQYPASHYIPLYDNNRFNDIVIYSDREFAECIIGIIMQCPNSWRDDLESLTEWFSVKSHNQRFGGLEKWFQAKNHPQIKGAFRSIVAKSKAIEQGKNQSIPLTTQRAYIEKTKNNFDINVLDVISEENTVYLFFPPYSRLKYALWKQYSPYKFQAYLDYINHVVQTTSEMANVKVFGFDDAEFVDDIANYKDPGHYHKDINLKMLKWMKSSQHEITYNNIDNYIDGISESAINYNISYLAQEIEKQL
jgi:hypothetical protein